MRIIRVSSATPTTVTQVGWSPNVCLMRRPMGSRPGHMRSANAALTIATGGAPAPSPAVNPRPASTAMPIASKSPGETIR